FHPPGDDVHRRSDLTLSADEETLRIGADRNLLVADWSTAQEHRVAHRGRSGCRRCRLLRRGRNRQEQQKHPSTMETAHCFWNRISYARLLRPSRMTSPDDYAALHEGAAIGAIAPRGQIAVAGADRAAFLHGLLTNDTASLTAGHGCY